jgi:bifunctional N-acetylglucosamine-1-phosphate-uridyltransferase/glucosamine-1-phosphate-acetyltransferase GlmU-like protein
MYRNPATRQAWKFFGKTTVHEAGDVREAVKARTVQAEIDRDQDGTGFAVMVELERVETMAGEVLMSKD